MKNFDFLKNVREFEPLYRYCDTAETYQLYDPEKSAVASRRALEYLVKLIYTVKGWDIPERASLFSLVDDYDFKAFIGSDDLMMRIHYIRKCGNNAAHDSVGSRVGKRQAFFALLNLHVFVGTILQRMFQDIRLERLDYDIGRRFGKRGIDPTGMKPSHPQLPKDIFKADSRRGKQDPGYGRCYQRSRDTAAVYRPDAGGIRMDDRAHRRREDAFEGVRGD